MRNDFESNYLAHHGILGMKWGVRRYQNLDGTSKVKKRKKLTDKRKRVIKKAVGIGVTAGVVYGSYRFLKGKARSYAYPKNIGEQYKNAVKLADKATDILNKHYAKKVRKTSIKKVTNTVSFEAGKKYVSGKNLAKYTMNDLKRLDLY